MRSFITKDIFTLSRLIKKLDIAKDIQAAIVKITNKNKNDDSLNALGVELFMALFDCLDRGEKDLVAFFADLAEVTPEEFQNMTLKQLGEFIHELKNMEGLTDFFTLAFKTAKLK